MIMKTTEINLIVTVLIQDSSTNIQHIQTQVPSTHSLDKIKETDNISALQEETVTTRVVMQHITVDHREEIIDRQETEGHSITGTSTKKEQVQVHTATILHNNRMHLKCASQDTKTNFMSSHTAQTSNNTKSEYK